MIDFRRLQDSFGYAWRGIKENYKKEQNFRIQLLVGIIVFVIALALRFDWERMVALLVIICIVLVTEMMNSALERYIDKLSPDEDHRICFTKDVLAGAVLITSIMAVFAGIAIFYTPITKLF